MKQPTAIFAHDSSFFKPPGAPELSFHQDHSHLPFDRHGCVTLWIALVDMSEDMGPLRYLEGSHHEGPLGLRDPERGILEVYPQLGDRKIVPRKPLLAGDAQAHWALTVHGSAPNNTESPREAVAFRYIRSDTVYTGWRHAHFDPLHLNPGDRFRDIDLFTIVGPDGPIER